MKKLLESKKAIWIFGAIFLAGVLIFIIGEYHFNKDPDAGNVLFDEDAYEAKLEEKLKNMIAAVCKDENVRVMVVLESSAGYCYEKEAAQTSSGLIFGSDQNASASPVLTRIDAPKIRGVSVVCPGGSDPARRLEIISLIAGTLHLSENRIYVTE